MKRGFLQVLLAALLLVAQYAALTHGLRHWQPVALTQAQQEDGGKQNAPSSLCDFHVAFAEVLGAVGSCAMPAVVAVQSYERINELYLSPRAAQFLAPLSRGPPVSI